MHKIHRLIKLLLIALLISTAASILAQAELDEEYISDGGNFKFSYPAHWQVDDSGDFMVITGGRVGRDFLVIDFFEPEPIADVTRNAVNMDEAVADLSNWASYFKQYEGTLPIAGREAGVVRVDVDGETGIGIVIETSDGGYGLILIFAEISTILRNEDFILGMVATYDVLNASVENTIDAEQVLQHYDGEWSTAVEELEELGYIGSGGSLVFLEDNAYFDGVGSWFTPLGRSLGRRNVVVAGELTFTSDSTELETCGLLARVVGTGNSISTYLEVGFDNAGRVYWFDAKNGEDQAIDIAPMALDLTRSHHVMFIVNAELLDIFINGKLIFEDVAIEERFGSYGIALLGRGIQSRCEGNNIWVYNIPRIEPGVCEATPYSASVNKRSDATTDSERRGVLSVGETARVVGQITDADGFVWWQLGDQTWVRSDVVQVEGDCGRVPVLNL